MAYLAKIDGLTEMQSRFVQEYVATGDVQRACALAGYTDNVAGYHNMKLPAVQAAIKAEAFRVLHLQAFPAAVRFLMELVNDEDVEKRLRADASRTLIKTVHDFDKLHNSNSGNNTTKPLDQMSPEELRQHLERMQQELANRATPVINAPVTRQTTD